MYLVKSIQILNNTSAKCITIAESHIIIGYDNGSFEVYSEKSHELEGEMYAHDKPITSIVYNDGLVYTGSFDKTIKCWTLGEYDHYIVANVQSRILCMVWWNNYLVSGHYDGILRFWNANLDLISQIPNGPGWCIRCLITCKIDNNDFLISGHSNGMIMCKSRTFVKTFLSGDNQVIKMCISGDYLCVGHMNGIIRCWNMKKIEDHKAFTGNYNFPKYMTDIDGVLWIQYMVDIVCWKNDIPHYIDIPMPHRMYISNLKLMYLIYNDKIDIKILRHTNSNYIYWSLDYKKIALILEHLFPREIVFYIMEKIEYIR